jgi:hypothetical protein
MRKLMFDPMFFALNWYICLFTDKLPEKISIAILDLIIIRGSEFLHNVALAILFIMQDQILAAQEFQELFRIIESHSKLITEPRSVLEIAMTCKDI